VAVGLLAVLAVAIIGSRPTTSEPTIETIVYSDPKTGLVLEDPPGSTPRVIVSAGGPSGEMPPCFPSDVVAGRSACWSSVAVSQSGRYLALHAGAASVTSILTIDGREVSHVYDGQEGTARWSPVEDVMAINHGVELHIVDSGGQTTKRIPLLFDIEGVHGWSLDGRHVLVRAMDAFDLWAVDVVSGASTRLTDTPTVHEHESDWSPDGSLIAYTADCGDAWTPGGPCPSSIWTVRPDGSDARRLTPQDGSVSIAPVWAPDGRHLAYTQAWADPADPLGDANVYVINPDGSDLHRITKFDDGFAGVLAWSPDGSMIIVARIGEDRATGLKIFDTWIVAADGSNPRVLVPGTIYVDQVWASSDDQPASNASPRH
jgi:dipeptidyl aminopeptidase/acylaminoacyl peptidase